MHKIGMNLKRRRFWPKNCLTKSYTMEKGQMLQLIGFVTGCLKKKLKQRNEISSTFSTQIDYNSPKIYTE